MADPKGFLSTPRETPARRPAEDRLRDWREVYEPFSPNRLERQAGRCMHRGIPFCHSRGPLGNLIPEWNDLVWRRAGCRQPAARHERLGWEGTSGDQTVQKVTDRVLAAAQPGEIVLMHLGSNLDDGTMLDAAALPAIISGLQARGYRRPGWSSAEVAERRSRGLANEAGERTSRSVAEILRANILTRFNFILGTLLAVILVAGQPQDALFGIVLVTNALIGIGQELRAKLTLDRLAVLSAPRVQVIRDGTASP